jgi:2-succinyl-5-enolpyruvyl-6-hydroxy-3-cyclohexene-1-carboxylate synthase
MQNIELARQVIQELVNTGVREFVLCAGARNSPLVMILNENQCPHIKIYNCFEERSAAFFALGRIASTRRPVAVITTSGTAVAELLPAAVEATYSALPLILVTADRPKIFRGTGAPQSIDQVGLFSYYIEVALDVDRENSHLSFRNLSWKKPIHVNVCFDEPLIDGPIPKIEFDSIVERTRLPEQEQMHMLRDVDEFLKNHHPFVILGFIPERAHETVVAFLEKYEAPIYAENISSLRGHPRLKDLTIKSGEKMINRLLGQGVCDSILRIGGVPTLRFWRDLEEKHRHLPVMSVSYTHFTGLSRPVQHFTDMEILKEFKGVDRPPLSPELRIADSERHRQLETLLQRYPESEPALIHQLSVKLQNQSVYLGNSLPIREWDLAASYEHMPARVVGNRGANGIDGQISSFLGWCTPQHENWCLVGDLTAMYDLVSPWIVPQLEAMKIRIVVINNKGGQIFKKMFGQEIFINPHSISFKSWAEMWKWDYAAWEKIPAEINLADQQIIELLPNAVQTDAFWKEWDSLWID